MIRDNPIVQRAALLHDVWVEFLDAQDARLLCMVGTAEERKLIGGFVGMESDEHTGRLPDLFITLQSGYAEGADHGVALMAELGALLAPSGEGAESEGGQAPAAPPLHWLPPARAKKEPDPVYFARAAAEFAAVAVPQAVLCFVLEPQQMTAAAAYQDWLRQVIAELPPAIRLWVIDDIEHPCLAELAVVEPVRVKMRSADLDLPGARAEISGALPDGDLPSGRFRNGYLELVASIAAGDVDSARQQATTLQAVAEAAGWFYLVVPVQFALASALLAQEDHQGALHAYEVAEAAALMGASHELGSEGGPEASLAPGSNGEVSGSEASSDAMAAAQASIASAMRGASAKLRLPARLAQGSVLVAAGTYPRAAAFYEETATLARELEQPLVVMDCLRLASFCHHQAGDSARAWKHGVRGLEVARELPDEDLASSTLPYLGDHLLRMTEQLIAYRDHGGAIVRELDERLGKGWRPGSG